MSGRSSEVANIILQKKNEVYNVVKAEEHVHRELSEYFTFDVPEAKFMPLYRNKVWDGKIRLYSPGNGEIYGGLTEHIHQWCAAMKYTLEFEDNDHFGPPYEVNDISQMAVRMFMKNILKNSKFEKIEPRPYQIEGVTLALKYNRKLLLSPTGSGKSLMVYAITRFHVAQRRKVLLVVPTTSLVEQMYQDFIEYGWNVEKHCHKIYAGADKYKKSNVTITTWQSIYKEPRKFFEKYDVVLGDEAHLFKSKSLTKIMTKLHSCKYRIGFTGTLDGTLTHKWILEGLFGPCEQLIKTKQLMDKGHLTPLKVKCLVLKHEWGTFDSYQDEIDYLISHEKRNNLIKNLCIDLRGNTLVLFNYVERHGEPLYNLINNSTESRKVFFVHGGVDVEDREEVRRITELEENAIIVASYGTFSTGINIKRLHNIVFASPSKSRIRNLQSIGRVLRRGKGKTVATLYDISDNISRGEWKNFTFKHFEERLKIYADENFDYEIIKVQSKF